MSYTQTQSSYTVRHKAYYEKNKTTIIAKARGSEEKRLRKNEVQRAYRARNIDKIRTDDRARGPTKRAKAPPVKSDKHREYNLRKTYGLEPGDFERMLAAQGGVCAICGTDTPKGKGNFHVDHCHSTGAVRGLLCHDCNTGLGKFKDDTAQLQKAISYLNSYTKVPNG
jgi:hypothetical protein